MTNNQSDQNRSNYTGVQYDGDYYTPDDMGGQKKYIPESTGGHSHGQSHGQNYSQNYGQNYGQNYSQGSSYNRRSVQNPYDDLYELEDERSSGGFVLGAIIGGLIGAAAAMFLTPKSGKEMREQINTQASTLKEKAPIGGSSSGDQQSGGGITQQLKEQSSKVVDKVKNIKGGGSQSPMDDGTASSEGEEQIDMPNQQGSVDVAHERGQDAFASTADALKEAVEEVKEEKKSSGSAGSGSSNNQSNK